MGNRVTFDYSKASCFISEAEVESMKKIVTDAKELLTSRTGAGNDFLGWIDLPVNYDKEEFARIKKAAEKIKSDSEVLLVAHNIQFDLLFILEMFKRCGMVPKAPKLRALDSLTVYKDRAAYPHKLANAIEHYGLADKVQNSHRAIDDVLALYEVTKAMSEERDDLTDYIDLLGYNPKYGITGRKLRQITYMPQSYKLGCRLPDLMNGGGSCE